jgi:hypothetical protein
VWWEASSRLEKILAISTVHWNFRWSIPRTILKGATSQIPWSLRFRT